MDRRPSWSVFAWGAFAWSAFALAACRPAEPPAAPSVVEVRAASPPEVDEEHRPLGEAELENLVAFTRVLGYVHYFHPSDGALVADWDTIAVQGVPRAAAAATPEGLVRVLRELFRPVAPTVVVHLTGSAAATPPALLPPAEGPPPAIVAWRHDGLGTSASRVFTSRRIDDRPGPHAEPGALVQTLDAAPYRGKRVRVRAAVRAEVKAAAGGTPAPEAEAGALFGLRVALPGGLDGFVDEMVDRPIVSPEWRRYEVSGDVDEDAETLSIGVRLQGEGRAFLDDVSLEVMGPKGGEPIKLVNAGFEDGSPGQLPPGWTSQDTAEKTGYKVELSRERPLRGRSAGAITSVALPAEALPPPARTFHADLGAGVSCEVPLTLYFGEGGTLPLAPWPRWRRPNGPFAFDPRDRATRLASVAVLWSALQHFYPYFDGVPVDWTAELKTALSRAAVDRDDLASLSTLRRMVAALRDGHGSVVLHRRDDLGVVVSAEPEERALPLVWDWVEGQLVITGVPAFPAHRLRLGDVVTAIDGVPAREALEATLAEISAATPQHARAQALRKLTLAPLGRSVLLSVKPRWGMPYILRVVHELPIGKPAWVSERRPAPVAEVDKGVLYVDLERIGDDDFDRALPALESARAIVFDLRGQPSHISLAPLRHLIDGPVESPHALVPRITRPDREGMEFTLSTWSIQPAAPRLRAKVAFLADGRSVSYAETYLSIVERYRLGEIVGGPSAGTIGTTNSVRLPGGFTATFTGMRVLKYDGSRLHGVGILPTIPVSRTIEGVAAREDEVLVRAVEAVSNGL